MIKKYNMYIKENIDDLDELDYEEEEDEPEMVLIGWKGNYANWIENFKSNSYPVMYILQEILVDENIAILYNNNNFQSGEIGMSIKDLYDILSKEELEKYIYTNKYEIHINVPAVGWRTYYWKDLPKEIKDLL